MPNSPSLVLALIDMLVVQSHIMWSWSKANSHNWTSCFLFSSLLACFTVWPCFSIVHCCTLSFVSGQTVWFFFLSSYIVHCNSALGPRFCANKIISYHIISYHIISYHIISYHIISLWLSLPHLSSVFFLSSFCSFHDFLLLHLPLVIHFNHWSFSLFYSSNRHIYQIHYFYSLNHFLPLVQIADLRLDFVYILYIKGWAPKGYNSLYFSLELWSSGNQPLT